MSGFIQEKCKKYDTSLFTGSLNRGEATETEETAHDLNIKHNPMLQVKY